MISLTAVLVPAPPRSPHRILRSFRGTLVERTYPRAAPEPIWAETPKAFSCWGIRTQQGKKRSETETGTLINPSPVSERKPCFYHGQQILDPTSNMQYKKPRPYMHLGYLFGGLGVVNIQLPPPRAHEAVATYLLTTPVPGSRFTLRARWTCRIFGE